MSSYEPYKNLINNYRKNRKKRFTRMEGEGYIFGTVVHFDNDKGTGVAVDADENRYVLHYNNMWRINYKILSKDQEIHFKPGTYNGAKTAEDIAIVY